MKKIILLLILISTISNAQKGEAVKDSIFNRDLKIKFESIKNLPTISENGKNVKVMLAEKIIKISSDTSFVNEVKEYVLKLKNTSVTELDKGAIDLSKVSEVALKDFKVKTDKFTKSTFITHKNVEFYDYYNSHIYITVSNGNAYLRLKWGYRGDGWVFYKKMIFLIDGETYDYIPNDIKTDVVSGTTVVEKFDNVVNAETLILIRAIANAKDKIEVRFSGEKTHDQKYSNKMCRTIKETLELYDNLQNQI